MHTKRMIGLIARDLNSIFQTPLIQAVQRELQQRSYRLLAFQGEVSEIVEAHLAEDLVAGWIAINTHEQAEILYQRGTPIILISAVSESLPCVLPDNDSGIIQAVEHLLQGGRQRIGFVTNSINYDFRERYRAYTSALRHHHIEPDPALLIDIGSYDVDVAYQIMRKQMASLPPFDALICANDWLAFGTLQALREAHLHIPNDVAVIGFDDAIEAIFSQPPLSSIRQDPTQIGLSALHMLLEWIEHGIKPAQYTRIPTQLIIRQSSSHRQPTPPHRPLAAAYQHDAWQMLLIHDLVEWLIAPTLRDPRRPAESYWPEITQLVDSFASMLAGTATRPIAHTWWEPLLIQWRKSEDRHTLLDILRHIGLTRLAQHDTPSIERLFNWLFACKDSIEHCFLSLVINQAEFDRQRAIAEAHLLGSISANGQSPQQLTWMEYSYADWAALALWQEPTTTARTHPLAIQSIYSRQHGLMEASITIPPQQLLNQHLIHEPIHSANEYMLIVISVISATRHWGYLIAAERFFWSFNNHLRNRVTFLATALELEHQTLELRDLSFRDSLTGLHNRRYLSELFPQKLEQSNRYRRPMAMVVMDLDHFKQINDTYTHAGGDQVLITIGQLMRENHRAADCCFRLGGEEFAIILPETSSQAARLVCERFRLIIEEHNWDALYPGLRVTMSIGAAMAREGDTIHTLINRADECLYRAKRAGRNRVELLEY